MHPQERRARRRRLPPRPVTTATLLLRLQRAIMLLQLLVVSLPRGVTRGESSPIGLLRRVRGRSVTSLQQQERQEMEDLQRQRRQEEKRAQEMGAATGRPANFVGPYPRRDKHSGEDRSVGSFASVAGALEAAVEGVKIGQPSGRASNIVVVRAEEGSSESVRTAARQPSRAGALLVLKVLAWYGLSVGYNVHNKRVLSIFPLPLTTGVLQLLCGSVFTALLWVAGARQCPRLSRRTALRRLLPVGLLHASSHTLAQGFLVTGSVSMLQVLKAGEPLCTDLLTSLVRKSFSPALHYLALAPVLLGIGLTSFQGWDLTWAAFGGAMAVNVFAAARAVLSKHTLGDKERRREERLSPANLYAMLSLLGGLALTPIALGVEGRAIAASWRGAMMGSTSGSASGAPRRDLMIDMVLATAMFHSYYELSFVVLDRLSSVSHAVLNCLKRVVLIGFGAVVFGTQVRALSAFGAVLAVGGALCYSLLQAGP